MIILGVTNKLPSPFIDTGKNHSASETELKLAYE